MSARVTAQTTRARRVTSRVRIGGFHGMRLAVAHAWLCFLFGLDFDFTSLQVAVCHWGQWV